MVWAQAFGLAWAWSRLRPKHRVCDLILDIQLLFPEFGVGYLYSCDMLKVGSLAAMYTAFGRISHVKDFYVIVFFPRKFTLFLVFLGVW